jgi:poly(hydroxyalkanoate) depolymerase family esterase
LRKLNSVLSSLAANKSRWLKLLRSQSTSAPFTRESHLPSRLREVMAFGSNPGNLRMFDYAPRRMSRRPALVIALHGCTQTATSFDYGMGWSKLADRHGFVVLAPQQEKSNNPNNCFTWFQPDDTVRDRGEAMSIRQMIDWAIVDHDINPARVFVTGLSAGGAMASVMLAVYPEIFAGGAIVAGLPFGAAATVEQAFESMFKGPRLSGDESADLVRRASAHAGPWPKISVWHGAKDQTVKPENATAIVEQWTRLHALPATATRVVSTGAYRHRQWANAHGETLVEEFLVAGMGHGVPLAAAGADGIGTPGPYFFETGVSSTERIAAFWGIAAPPAEASARPSREGLRPLEPAIAEAIPSVPWPANDMGTDRERRLLEEDARPDATPETVAEPGGHQRTAAPRADVGAIIEKALRTAGLLR